MLITTLRVNINLAINPEAMLMDILMNLTSINKVTLTAHNHQAGIHIILLHLLPNQINQLNTRTTLLYQHPHQE
jgi:hypothetical protein